MEINDDFREIFREHGLDSFDSFMDFEGGEVRKRITLRSITRFTLPLPGGGERGFYLKRHTQKAGFGDRRKARLGRASSEAKREWDAIEAFKRAGVPALEAAAYGERFSSKSTQEAFLVTVALDDFTQLETLVHDFAPPLSKMMIMKKRALIEATARLVKKLHDEGFNHRDLYLTHIMARWDADGETGGEGLLGGSWSLKLIDLQRCEERSRFRGRWLVKDIAALNYSSPKEVFTRADRLRFFKTYRGGDITKDDRSFIAKVLKKTERIAEHTVKMYKKREERKKKGLLER